jgi:hypothetical protein
MNFAALTPGYTNDAIQNTLETMQKEPTVATFGTNLVDATTNLEQPPPIVPWTTTKVYGDFTLGCYKVDDPYTPVLVHVGQYTFFPVVTVMQENGVDVAEYYNWNIGTIDLLEDVTSYIHCKMVWGAGIDEMPDYAYNETPDPNNTSLVRKTLSIKLLGYTVHLHYHENVFYFVIFPLKYASNGDKALYIDQENTSKLLSTEIDKREFSFSPK